MASKLFLGSAYIFKGFRTLSQPGLRLFVLVPLLVNIALFAVLIMWAKSMFSGLMASLMAWLPEWLAFLEWLFWLLYALAIIMTIFYGFVAAANLLAAPFYGFLSEVVEEQASGTKKDETLDLMMLVKMIPRTLKRELQKIAYYLPRVIALLLLGLIPGVNAVVALVWIIFSGWMMAIQYLDYPADNNGMSFPDMRDYLRQHRMAAFGFGILTFGLTLIPILNLLTLPAAVCGGTLFWVDHKEGRKEQLPALER